MSIFDADTFINSICTDSPTEHTGALLPEGEYEAVIKAVSLKETKEKGIPMLTIRWFPEVPAEIAGGLELDPEKAFTIQQRVFLDINSEGKLAKGKNINLGIGRVRTALGQNGPGDWSVSNLIGGRAKVRVTQVLAYNDPTRTLNEISGVTGL